MSELSNKNFKGFITKIPQQLRTCVKQMKNIDSQPRKRRYKEGPNAF